jgi:hypothetical protein
MITEAGKDGRKGLPLYVTIPMALGAWFLTVAVFTLAAEPTRDVFVIGSARTTALLPSAGVVLVDAVNGIPRVRGDTPGYVMRLYAQGAWLVLPALEGGCLGIPPSFLGKPAIEKKASL